METMNDKENDIYQWRRAMTINIRGSLEKFFADGIKGSQNKKFVTLFARDLLFKLCEECILLLTVSKNSTMRLLHRH